MSCIVTTAAPNFNLKSVDHKDCIQDFSLLDSLATPGFDYTVLVFFPLAFTFVCPTELIALDNRMEEFESRRAQVLAISVDSVYTLAAWRKTSRNHGGIGSLKYRLLADLDKTVARNYGVLLNGSVALRATFLIDRHGIIQHQEVNNLPLGRDFNNTIRTIDALNHFETKGEVCPAGWQKGKKAMKADAESVACFLRDESEKI